MFKFGFGQKRTQQSQQPTDPFVSRLNDIINSYSDKSDKYKFYWVFLNSKQQTTVTKTTTTGFGANKMGTQGNKPKPKPFISDEIWNSACALAGDDKEPTLVTGFDQLKNRREGHKKILEKMDAKLKQFQSRISDIQSKFNDIQVVISTDISINNQKIFKSLIDTVSFEELKSLQTVPFSHEEQDLFDKLESIQSNIQKPNQYHSQMNKVKLLSKLIQDQGGRSTSTFEVPPEKIGAISEILDNYTQSIKEMTEVIKGIQNFVKAQEKLLKQT